MLIPYQLRVIIHVDIIYFALYYIPGKKFHKNLSTTISLVTLTKTNQSFQLKQNILHDRTYYSFFNKK
jgi:hypothetical protein